MMLVTVRRLTFRWVATCCFVLQLRAWPAESSASRGRLWTRNRPTARSQWFNSNRTRCPVLEKGRIPRCIQWPIVRTLTWRCCATCALVRHCFSAATASTAVFSGMRICLATIRAALRCRCHYGPLPPGEGNAAPRRPVMVCIFQAGIAIKGEFQPEVVAAKGPTSGCRNKSLPTARMSFTRRSALTRQPRPGVKNRAAPLALVAARLAWQVGLPFRIWDRSPSQRASAGGGRRSICRPP